MRGVLGLGLRLSVGAARRFGEILFVIIDLLQSTCTRATIRTVLAFPVDGVIADGESIQTIGINQPAIKGSRYLNPGWSSVDADGEALTTALSVFDASTNLPTFSEDLTGTGWTTNGATIDSAVKTFGDLSLDRINVTATSERHNAAPASFTIVSGSNYTSTAFLEDDGERFVFISLLASANDYITAVFDTLDGSMTDSDVGSTSGTLVSASAVEVDDGLWRVKLTGSLVFASAFVIVGGAGSATPTFLVGQPTYTALAGEDIIAGGIQCELGDVATAYTKTEAASVTRDSDINTVPTSSVLDKDLGAERIQFTPAGSGQVNKYLRSFFVDATHRIDLYINATQVLAEYVNGASTDVAAFTYTHIATTPMLADIYWDSVVDELGVRAADQSGNIDGETFQVATFAGLDSLPATSDIGHKDGADIAQGEFANNGFPVDYKSKEVAGWT